MTQELPETKVYILAAKPSPLRWNLKTLYDTLNTYFADFARENMWHVLWHAVGMDVREIAVRSRSVDIARGLQRLERPG